jgi:hypothetical protein
VHRLQRAERVRLDAVALDPERLAAVDRRDLVEIVLGRRRLRRPLERRGVPRIAAGRLPAFFALCTML